MSCSVYILFSAAADQYYIRVTKDVDKRLAQHNAGYSRSTQGRGPWEVVYTEGFGSRSEARKRESFLKQKKSRVYLEYLIERTTSGERPERFREGPGFEPP